MKKNLKKVISAVVAFALTASSAAFAAAPSFTDVADTASYAEAVNTLTALGVISGYEDGTFKPEDKITRAEVSTMIVAAINRTADAQGQMGNTKFADMNNEAKKWASGYVNVAVSEDIIAGFEDGTFKPDEQVTYVQVVKMLVCAAGYGQYASYLGGWPNGYLSVASDKGITAGVSAGQDEAVTRAQVAQLIYNTLDVPMVASNGFSISETTGAVVPSLKVMDGKEDRDYQTLLTEKHRAYKVEGYVSATNRTNSAKCDADEVEFTIQYTENYDDSDIVVKKNQESGYTYPTDTIYVGDTDAADYLLTYATGIVKFDENDDPTFVSFVPSGKNKVEEFDASLIDDDDLKIENGGYVRFFANKSASKSTKYSLEKDLNDVRLFVNGVEVDMTATNFDTYVTKNTTGKVQLIDTYTAQSKANGYYDVIFVTYYATAKVDSVNVSNYKIAFDSCTERTGSLTLDTEADDELVDSITLNGEAIELSALQADDILSIAFDVDKGLADSKFYEILVSRDTAEGKYTGKSSDDETITIGGTEYEFVEDYATTIGGFNLSDEYTVYLDAFGRIYDYETLASSAKLAIIDRYTKASSDDYYKASLYTSDGAVKTPQVDTSKVTSFTTADGTVVTGATNINAAIEKLVYKDTNNNGSIDTAERSNDNKHPIEKRVVKYKLSSSTGYVTSLEIAKIEKSAASGDDSFKSSNNSVGSVKMSASTKVIDATDYCDVTTTSPTTTDLSTSSLSAFVVDTEYKVYAYGDRNSDGTYPMVIVTYAGGTFTNTTSVAVLSQTPEEGTDNDGDIYNVTAYYVGSDKEQKLVANDDVVVYYNSSAIDVTSLAKGDIIVFERDGAGKIKRIDKIVSGAAFGTETSYEQVVTNAFAGTTSAAIKLPMGTSTWTTAWSSKDSTYPSTNKDVTQLLYGPIVNKNGNVFTLGTFSTTDKTTAKTNIINDIDTTNTLGDSLEINITDDTKVYVYDYNKASRQRLSVGTKSDIMSSIIPKTATEEDGDIIVWSKVADTDTVNFAFVKAVDGDATDVFVILDK